MISSVSREDEVVIRILSVLWIPVRDEAYGLHCVLSLDILSQAYGKRELHANVAAQSVISADDE